jgi:acyl carrier protein
VGGQQEGILESRAVSTTILRQASSLDRMTLMLALEDEFGGTVPPEDAYRIKTVANLVDYIESRLQPA